MCIFAVQIDTSLGLDLDQSHQPPGQLGTTVLDAVKSLLSNDVQKMHSPIVKITQIFIMYRKLHTTVDRKWGTEGNVIVKRQRMETACVIYVTFSALRQHCTRKSYVSRNATTQGWSHTVLCRTTESSGDKLMSNRLQDSGNAFFSQICHTF